jgi:hypothetical protein
VTTRIIGTTEMGWDQIADTLGGLMVGGALGMAGWLLAVWFLDSAGRLWLTGAAVVGCIGASIFLVSTEPRMRSGRIVDIPAPAVPQFGWQISVADGLAGPPPDGKRLPWEFLRIASNLSLDYVPAGKTGQQCFANNAMDTDEGIAALKELRAILVAMPADFDCGEPCPSCMDVSLQWFLDDRRVAAMITDRCWLSHAQLQPLRASVERLFAKYGAGAECSPSTP